MKRQYVHKLGLPDSPGVYIFKDYKKMPLYIGRATSLRDRVKSYFSADLIETRGPRIIDMVTRAKSLSIQKSGSVLEAIILESNLIKKYQPTYNAAEKDDKSSQYVVITDELWPRVFLVRARDFDEMNSARALPYKVSEIFGPYPYGGLIKEALRILRKLFPFKDKKSYDPRHDRFYRSISRSPDQGTADIDANLPADMKSRSDTEETFHIHATEAHEQYMKTIKYLVLFFQGKKVALRAKIERDMKRQALTMHFEEAGESKRLLYALDHINDISLIKADKVNANGISGEVGRALKMEAYDVAHLSGTNVVGGMVVALDDEITSGESRKFKISKQANNDTAALAEILLRRFNHTEWTYPDIIVVDGNEVQVKVAESVLRSRRLNIPIIGVTKNAQHRADRLIGDTSLVGKYRSTIIRLNAEAHRYTIAFHRQRRGKIE